MSGNALAAGRTVSGNALAAGRAVSGKALAAGELRTLARQPRLKRRTAIAIGLTPAVTVHAAAAPHRCPVQFTPFKIPPSHRQSTH